MKIEYTAKQLDDFSIFALRDLARDCGHKSPTNKKKGELIEFILGLKGSEISKDAEPETKKRRGRPPKKNVPQMEAVAELNQEEKKEDKKEENNVKSEVKQTSGRFNLVNQQNKKEEENKEKAPEIPENKFLDQFNGLETDTAGIWKISKDGGNIEYRTGATVSSRAITALVDEICKIFAANREKIQEASK